MEGRRADGLGSSGANLTIAAELSTSAEALEQMAGDWSATVRIAVASNPSTPPMVLERLAADQRREVVEALILNPSTPAAVLHRLAHSGLATIRAAAWHALQWDTVAASEAYSAGVRGRLLEQVGVGQLPAEWAAAHGGST